MPKYFIEIILDDEKWVDMIYPDIETDKYMISNYGRVYSKYRNRLLKPGVNHRGYIIISIKDSKGKPITRRVNRLVALHFIPGHTEEKNQVNHKDGIKANNYYKNLEWMTSLENNRHAIDNNLARKVKGEENPSTNYKDIVIVRICELLERCFKGSEIADIIIEEFPELNYSRKKIIKYINDKIKTRRVRTDISSNFVF